ncbi:uncharacterized protein LOC141914792 isoform X2 [Tubulanus polymorphus]|uniref:uncharacterized protein LOC141914792 isoform X2 n=1 Tax=Tubulanus polymorphus TaxID=672921 RepID=UPI003DA4E6B1
MLPTCRRSHVSCTFRWAKTVCTHAGVLYLEGDFLHVPSTHSTIFGGLNVPLTWNSFKGIYESLPVIVACGSHTSHLLIDDVSYAVETFHVNSFTFEVNLVIKEEDPDEGSYKVAPDVEEDEAMLRNPRESSSAMAAIKHSSKIEALLQKQMHKSGSAEQLNEMIIEKTASSPVHASNGSLRGHRAGSYDRISPQQSPHLSSAIYKSADRFGGSIDRLGSTGSRTSENHPKMSPRSHSSSQGDLPVNSKYHSEKLKKPEPEYVKYASEQVLNAPINSDVPFYRVGSSHSNPTPTTPAKYTPYDDRSMTPDTYNRSNAGLPPNMKSPLITSRTSLSTHSSARTLTPKVANGDAFHAPTPIERTTVEKRVEFLESELFNANQRLEDQDIEVTKLQHQIQDLEAENSVLMREVDRERRKPALTTHQDESSYNRVIAEKETLATEVIKLKAELDRLQSEQRQSDSGESNNSIDRYSPDNPNALKRKNEELRSQVQDLQEAHESAALEFSALEKKIAELTQENDGLRTANSMNIEDVQAENQYLAEQIRDLKKKSTQYLNDSSDRMREEMKLLRVDMRALRDRNSELNEENLKLRDQLTELRLRAERRAVKHDASALTNGYHNSINQERISKEKFERSSMAPVESLADSSDRVKKVEKYLEDNRTYATESTIYDGQKSHNLTSNMADGDDLTDAEPYPSYSHFNNQLRSAGASRARRNLNLDEIDTLDAKGEQLLTDRSDSTAFLTSNLFTRMFEPIDFNDNELAEYPKRYPYPPSTRSGTNQKMPPIKPRGHAMSNGRTSYRVVDDVHVRSPRSTHNENFEGSRPLPRTNLTDSFNLKNYEDDDDDGNSTSSILSEVEREIGIPTKHLRTRSSHSKRRSASSPPLSPRVLSPVGFRSVSPKPVATQHNKSLITSPRESKLSTSGKRPYVPRSPADVQLGSIVKFSRQTGQISRGLVRFVGHLPGRDDTYLGLELENEDGKHDGTYNNVRYFSCKPNKGVFVTFNKVVMAWAQY